MGYWRLTAALLVLVLALSACAGAAPTPTSTPTIEPTQAASPTPSATPAPELVDWHSFFGGALQSRHELSLTDTLPTADVPIFVRYSTTPLYAEQVPLDKLENVFNQEPPPEVISGFIGGAALNAHTEAGEVQPIEQLWQEMGWFEVFPQSVVEMAAVDGQQYYLPHAVQWNPIWYRTDIFDQYDLTPPESWDDLLLLCQDLRAEGVIPFTVSAVGWRPPLARWFTILNLRLNGPEFHQSLMAGEVPFDDPRVRDVFVHWLELFEADCFEEAGNNVNYGRAIERFSSGQAAMYNLGEWIYESLEPEVESQIDFFRFPVIDPSIPNGEIASVYGSYLPVGSENPEAGQTFLGFLGSVETQQSVVEEVARLVPDRRIDTAAIPAYQQKGMDFLEESGQLVTLFEFNTFSEPMAEAGLEAFAEFYNARSEQAIDPILLELEATRQDQLGGG